MQLERLTHTSKFKNNKYKSLVGLLYVGYYLKRKIHKMLKNFGLTSEQYNVLRILRGSSPNALKIKEITLRMVEQNSNVPRLVDKLEHKKLVVRVLSNSDKRETLVKITEVGLELIKNIDEPFEKLTENTIPLSDDDTLKLTLLIEALI